MTIKEELALLRKIVKLAKTVQNHVQFPPRGGQCWCEQCEAIRWYDKLKGKQEGEIMSKSATNTTETGGQVHPIVMPSSVGKQTAKFREELVKIMPGYNWTVHKPLFRDTSFLEATGIQSSGFNRLSTLKVKRWEKPHDTTEYEVMYAGSGTRAPWLSSSKNSTLARALRRLQELFEAMARTYTGAANDLQKARKA